MITIIHLASFSRRRDAASLLPSGGGACEPVPHRGCLAPRMPPCYACARQGWARRDLRTRLRARGMHLLQRWRNMLHNAYGGVCERLLARVVPCALCVVSGQMWYLSASPARPVALWCICLYLRATCRRPRAVCYRPWKNNPTNGYSCTTHSGSASWSNLS